MITVICGTNRPQNVTQQVAKCYCQLLEAKKIKTAYLSLETLPKDFVFHNDVYGNDSAAFHEMVEKFILPAKRLLIVSPEYNGSFPGVLKAFIDGMKPSVWAGKKIALTGVSAGRAGNLRGMDHLTNILNYLQAEVLPMKIPISRIEKLLDVKGNLSDQVTIDVLSVQVEELIDF